MNKYPVWLKMTLVASLLAGLLVTSAARFLSPSVNTHNGVVYAYAAGKSLTIRGFSREPVDYILNSKTQILPSSLSGNLAAGDQVTVYAQCFTTHASSGCIALTIYITSTANANSAGSTVAPSAPAPSAPVPTPTP